jgi:cohesin loading factor subunit SCC2
MKVYASALDGPYNIGRTVFVFLTSRYESGLELATYTQDLSRSAGRGKGTKTTNETEYRAILDTLLSDLLTVLYWPEWPGAALLLVVASKLLVSIST